MTTSTLADEILAQLRATVDDVAMPLASLAAIAVREGKVSFEAYLGRRYIDSANPALDRPVDANTLFRIASISKLMVTLGVMRLLEEGKLNLDADASEFLGFTLRNPSFADRPITLRMMLSHTSSMRDDAGYFFDSKSGLTLADVLSPGGKGFGAGKMWSPDAAPGDFFQYANLPWGVIGTMMERVTGERFDRLMQTRVIDPIGLVGGFSPVAFSPEVLGNVATLYRKRTEENGKEIWNPAGPWVPQVDDFVTSLPMSRAGDDYVPGTNGTLFGPQGNCRLTAQGLFRVMQLMTNEGEIDGKRVLTTASVRAMMSRQWVDDEKGKNGNDRGESADGPADTMNAWGLGVQHFMDRTGPGRGDRMVEPGGFLASGHLGEAYGLTSLMAFDPASRSGLIFLVGGVGADPFLPAGTYSSFFRYEERIMSALYPAMK